MLQERQQQQKPPAPSAKPVNPPADSSKSAPAPASTQKTGAAPAAGQDQQDQKADSLAAPTNPPAAPKTTPKNAGNSSFQSGIPEDSAPEIKIGVNEVNLIFTVTDKHGKFIKNLTKSDIHVLDDHKAVDSIRDLKSETDLPLRVGLLIDASNSIRDRFKFEQEAAIEFLNQIIRPQSDKAFVLAFDEVPDLQQDFTNDVGELKKALEQADPSSSTALYDATTNSLDRLKRGYLDKKVLLIVSDGEDNSSRHTLDAALQEAQRSSALIYAVGLLREEKPESAERDRQALLALTRATGGSALFPENLEDVESICTQIARDNRHQYTLAYYPTNSRKDGSFRSVRVHIVPPAGGDTISARTRTGYYAQRVSSGN